MPKYMIQACYTKAGLDGLLKDGGSKRREAVTKAAESIGGSVEAFYYAFGETDTFVIVDAPDNVSTAAVCLAVGASGKATTKTTALLTPEEIDAATSKSINYRPPGD